MTCEQIRHLAPLYRTGELWGDQRPQFMGHLAACPACERELSAQGQVDDRIARVLASEPCDTSRIERQVRREIYGTGKTRWRVWGAIAAGALLAIAGGSMLWRTGPPPSWYAVAALDHRQEVREGHPRRWRVEPVEIDQVAQRVGMSFERSARLAAAGYRLERAKICGVDGLRMLHLVFTNGKDRYSVFIGQHPGPPKGVRVAGDGSEQVAGLQTAQFRAAVVTEGSPDECEKFARVVVAKL